MIIVVICKGVHTVTATFTSEKMSTKILEINLRETFQCFLGPLKCSISIEKYGTIVSDLKKKVLVKFFNE